AKVLSYQDGKTASISLIVRGSQVTISTNGKPDASIEMEPTRTPVLDEITMTMAGALPLAYKPDARRIANIRLGSGLTTHTLLRSPSIQRRAHAPHAARKPIHRTRRYRRDRNRDHRRGTRLRRARLADVRRSPQRDPY